MGVFTMADACQAGYESAEIQRMCRNGEWVRLRRGMYTTASALALGSRHRSNCVATLLALGRPTTTVSHGSAARLLALPVPTGDDVVRLTDPTRSRNGSGFAMVRSPLASTDVMTSGPLRLTSPARTLADCARSWPLEPAVVAIDAALLSGRVRTTDIRQAVDAQHTWPGAPAARRALDLADGRAESPLETKGRLRIVGAGLPTPDLQTEIRAAGRLIAVVDAWFDEAAVAVEFDGRVKYTNPWRERTPERVLWEEKRREDQLRGLDIRMVRVVDADLDAGWPAVEERLRTLLAGPGPAQRRFTTTVRPRGVLRAG